MMKRGMVGSLLLGIVGSGCQWIGGLEDLSVTATGEGGQGGSGIPSSISGWVSGAEDCLNGVDDDANGTVDCADTACSMVGFACSSAIPTGWQFVSALVAPFNPDAPSIVCPDGSMATKGYAEPATTGTCTSCDCAYSDVVCGAPEVTCWYSTTNCSGSADTKIPAQAAGCSSFSNVPSGTMGSCQLTGPPIPTNPGTCTATGGKLDGPPMWSKMVHLCGVSPKAAGCASGETCLPGIGVGLMNGQQCIAKEGTNACPLDWIGTKLDAFFNGFDARTCSGCACDVKSITCSGGIVWVHASDNCSGSNVPIQFDSGCTLVETQFDNGVASAAGMAGGFASGGCINATVQGAVNPLGPLTICCH